MCFSFSFRRISDRRPARLLQVFRMATDSAQHFSLALVVSFKNQYHNYNIIRHFKSRNNFKNRM
jgi:hypothetical protein